MLVLTTCTPTAILSIAPALWAQDASASGQITIKDPAEFNAYQNAIGQAAGTPRATAIESFLTQYPQSVVKAEMLTQLMSSYQQAGNLDKTVDAANRLLQIDPNNLRALALSVYIKKAQAAQKTTPADAQPLLDDAAAKAQQGLKATKPAGVSQADFDKLKAATTPIFDSAIAADDVAKKDFKDAIDAYQAELKATPDAQTTSGPALNDTYLLGSAYVQEDPKDLVNGIWYLARAAALAPAPFSTQIDTAAQYWYKKYHGGPDGYDAVKAQAKTTVFPPAGFSIVPAPPPPSDADVVKKLLADPSLDLKTLAISDKEFILSKGSKEDADKVWAVLKDVRTEVPGTVIAATADQVQLAVTDDAKQSKTADFTINLKTPLKEVPAVGSDVKLVGTYDSYTQTPAQIILKDGEAAAAKKPAAPVHHRPAAH
jgi:tetratricopeptide (TPR) repeat protein